MPGSEPWSPFVDFWSQRQKMLESEFSDHNSLTSGGKVSNARVEALGVKFVDFWSQRQKMLKSEPLETMLSTSGGKAGKCANRS